MSTRMFSPWRTAAFVIALAAVLAPSVLAQAAESTFAVEPSYGPERTAEIYKPLLDYLDKATGQHFKLVTSRNYHFYWRDIHAATKTDFAFDEAHIADYRFTHEEYTPLVRAAEPTSYTLVTSDPDLAKKGLLGLVGHRIITMPSPSFGYVLLLEFYSNPVSQPDIRSTAGAWRDAPHDRADDPELAQVGLDRLGHPRVLDLDGDLRPVVGARAVDLAEGCERERLLVEV